MSVPDKLIYMVVLCVSFDYIFKSFHLIVNFKSLLIFFAALIP